MSAVRIDDVVAPRRETDFPAADRPLREDVNRVGTLVGEILAEQEGPEFLAEVERVRTAAIHRRESDAPVDALAGLLADLDVQHATALVRGFATYFQAINVAERVHRIRRRREYERSDAAPQPGGLRDVASALAREGVTAADLAGLLPRLNIEPVFTAHPTEAVRRSLLEKERALVVALIADLDRTRTPAERRVDTERMRTALTAAWQTTDNAPERPSVAHETEHVAYYLVDVLYHIVPKFYSTLADALREAGFGDASLPTLMRFGTWVGGDMDGNPNVGAETIAATLSAQRELVLAAYRKELGALRELLSQSLSRVSVAPAIVARIDNYRVTMPNASTHLSPRSEGMPYRQLVSLISARLGATIKERRDGYADAAEFRADVDLIAESLRTHQGAHAGEVAVRKLLRRIDTFGFHLAALDLRQDSAAHDIALAALFDDAEWPQRPVPERIARLNAVLDGGSVPKPAAPEAAATLAVFRTVQAARQRYGTQALGPYIISMSRSAADALAVLVLARLAGCVDENGVVPLDVAPLFETVADLDAARSVVAELAAEPHYRAHLAARRHAQLVMLGYSDSAKDGGLFASRWALQRTQVVLTELARESGLSIHFFHGRGGSASRGGGKTERAIVAAPRGSVDGYLRLTEQGEVIHRKYGIPALALRTLEQTTGAVLRASLKPRPPEPREAAWRGIATDISTVARQAYRDLVYERDGFADYFRAVTPIDVIERLRISSRPPRRAQAGETAFRIERLRAIPWVFAWSQNRCGLTAWYGVGAGLAHGIERYGLDAMREIARDWPFFSTLVEDMEMVLAKCDLDIFSRYSALAGGAHAEFYDAIAQEFSRTREAVLALRGKDSLLAGDRRLAMSIRLRNPYVDPISLLQVDLLARWRASERQDDALFQALVSTVNGIAAGVQNTG
jgi:phosphoenolpyruvate carboxylase